MCSRRHSAKPMDATRLSESMRASCSGSTVHGLRASFRTWAAEQGIERDVAEMVLAHALGTATELAYKRTDYFQRRVEVMEQWAAVGRRRVASQPPAFSPQRTTPAKTGRGSALF